MAVLVRRCGANGSGMTHSSSDTLRRAVNPLLREHVTGAPLEYIALSNPPLPRIEMTGDSSDIYTDYDDNNDRALVTRRQAH